ncbi:hypothetical protein [Labrys wisconsinensis]|uniref:AsmA-like C-terminal domain-containing protein n=1 Tax=Labrys wisconsinensis TaxID=425677 RepID=A0ABU0J2A3_9HYPH|nr:hypothetical protein [Labrys wisconsinensis]MDQ0468387.1 hypothetical protein [Labrys wisconsinensis]
MTPFSARAGRLGARIRRGVAASLVAGGLLAAASLPAGAEDAGVQNAGPAVTIGATETGQGGVTLSDVRIAYPGASGTTIAVRRIVVQGMEAAGQTLKATSIGIEGLTTTARGGPDMVVTVDKATLAAVAAPLPSSGTLSAAGKPGGLPPLAAWLLAAKAKSITIPSLSMKTSVNGITSEVIYRDTVLTGVDAGRIDAVTVAGLDQGTTASGAAGTRMSVGRMAIDALDFNAYAAWLDDSLAAAAPVGKQPVYKSFSLEKLSLGSDTMAMTIEGISGSDVKIGPPPMKPSQLAALLARMAADPQFGDKNPAEAVAFFRGLLKSFEIGSLEMRGLDVSEKGKPPVEIGLFRLENFAGTSIGEIRLGEFAVTDDPQGGDLQLGSFAIRGFSIEGLDPMLDRIARGESPETLPLEQYPKPRLAGIAMADLDVTVPGKGAFSIGGFTVDAPQWVGFAPSEIKGRIAGFSMPVDAIDDAEARDGFKSLGLGTLTINSVLDAAWTESDQTLRLGPVSLDIDGIGKIEVGGSFGGVPRSVFEDPQTAEAALATLDFRGLTLALTDGGAFGKLVDRTATEQKLTRAALADQAARQIEGGIIAGLGMADAGHKLGAAVKAFITDPKSFNLVIGTLEPIPALALSQLGNGDQASLELVKKAVQVEATANK